MPGPLNKDVLVVIIHEATDGYTAHYLAFKNRSPVGIVGRAIQLMSGQIGDPGAAPASDDDVEDLRISSDKANLKLEIGQAIDVVLN